MLSADLKAALDGMAYGGEGFQKGGDEVFYRACERLIGLGVSEEEAVELLDGLYWAVANEFGV